MRLCTTALILLLSVSALTLIEQAEVPPCPVDGGDLAHSQGALSSTDSIFANFTTTNTNTFMAMAYPIIAVDVWDAENVTKVWADLKRSNESDWTMMTMQHAPWPGNNTFQVVPSLSVSQTVTYFDVHFRANDTTGDMSTSQDFSFMITYSQPHGPVGLDLMGVVTIIAFLMVAAIIPVFLYLLRRERIKLGLQAVSQTLSRTYPAVCES